MPDLPLDEKALRAAINRYAAISSRPYEATIRRRAMRAAISTYLREAGFEVEASDGKLDFSLDKAGPRQCLVGPWLPIQEQEKE